MRTGLALLALTALLAGSGCGQHAAPDPGGLSSEDSQLLNNAAEMLDTGNDDAGNQQ